MVFRICQNHTGSVLLYQVKGDDGCPLDVSAASEVAFSLIKQDRQSTIAFKEVIAKLSDIPDYPPSEGWVIWEPQAAHTAEVEFYYGRFHITENSRKHAFPDQPEKLEVYVEREGLTT